MANNSPLKNIVFSNMIKLRFLDISHTSVSSIPVECMTGMIQLSIQKSNLHHINLR